MRLGLGSSIQLYFPAAQEGIYRDASIAWRTSTYSLTLNLCTLIIFRIASMRHHRHRSSLHPKHKSAVTPKHISKHRIELAHVVPCGAVAQRNTRENSYCRWGQFDDPFISMISFCRDGVLDAIRL